MKRSELKEFIKEEILTSLSEAEETVKDIQDKKAARAELNKELEKTAELSKDLGLEEDIDDDDDDVDTKAIKAAKGARGKHKKLDIAVKALKNITTEMKSIAREYSKADGIEKEKIKDKLKTKTAKKKELESLVAKLEKDVV
jgi:hypothetical protein|tara:strand:- start:924 stop:1349 length:426 start_codon:yes stop_codon:yes gene_type:complete